MERQGYRIEPSRDWEGETPDPYAVLPKMTYMAAEHIDDAHMRFIKFRTCDDEEAIEMIRSGWFGRLADVEDLIACHAILGQHLQLFRVTAD